jgi:hypothetical protein
LHQALATTLAHDHPGEYARVRQLAQPDRGVLSIVQRKVLTPNAVNVKRTARRADGKVAGMRELETHRNRWIVEKREFFEARAQAARTVRDTTVTPKKAVKQHPDLVGTYLQMRAAELAVSTAVFLDGDSVSGGQVS